MCRTVLILVLTLAGCSSAGSADSGPGNLTSHVGATAGFYGAVGSRPR